MKTLYKLLYVFAFLHITACDKPLEYFDINDGDDHLTGKSKYVVTATPVGTEGVADYLLLADNLESGSITTQGNGIEQDGSYRYYVTHKNRFFSMLYGQGNPGAVTTYRLDSLGHLVKVSNFQTETVQVFAPAGDDVLLMKVPRSGNEFCQMYRVNARQYSIVGEEQVNIVQLAGNGERAHFTWATQVGNKVYAPYMSIKGCCGDAFGTAFPDSSWVAVFSYPDLKVEKVIRDNRTSYIGAYFNNGLVETELGEVYAFSPAAATNSSKVTTTNPSAIVKINPSTEEFDQQYFFNIEKISGGYHIDAWTYLGENKFILTMYPEPNSIDGLTRKFAVVDVAEQSFKWVSGTPDDITSVTSINNYAPMDGITGYIGITTASEGSYVYVFDANLATAKKGLKVEGGTITAIHKLNY
ncbi:DUF4374 domain-containing protein [Olivibacter ginsenosidimutans]